MARFRGPNDFLGTYQGHWDGRSARLEIDDRVGDSGRWLCNIRLFDGDNKFVATNVTHSDPQHTIRDLELRGFDGTQGAKHIRLMLLQTCNTDYLCGYDVWDGKEYGFSFQRTR